MKSEIWISKSETISKFKYQIKKADGVFEIFVFYYLHLFRAAELVLLILRPSASAPYDLSFTGISMAR
jgi:hypothetical protein